MSYLNGQIGYREDLLETRSVVKKENYVLLEPDGIVKNAIPGYVDCDVTILGSPELGASFADYIVTAHKGGKNEAFGGEGLETFVYILEGQVAVKNADSEATLTEGGYIYSPVSNTVSFTNVGEGDAKLYIYKPDMKRLRDTVPTLLWEMPTTFRGLPTKVWRTVTSRISFQRRETSVLT